MKTAVQGKHQRKKLSLLINTKAGGKKEEKENVLIKIKR